MALSGVLNKSCAKNVLQPNTGLTVTKAKEAVPTLISGTMSN
jgi:hypothetical protein